MDVVVRLVVGDELPVVLQLYRGNSKTLGFLPKGAFQDPLQRGCLLGAFRDAVLLGYLLFRRSVLGQYAAITHLCVDPMHRGKGVSGRLVNRLVTLASDLLDIRAVTRLDYLHAARVWERHGFRPGPVGEPTGRSSRHGCWS